MSDNGSQPTSRKFLKECENLKINHILTNYNNPKDNADTERMMRTMKEECLWLDDRESFSDVKTKLTALINRYNSEYLHSALGWKSTNQVHQKAQNKFQKILKVA